MMDFQRYLQMNEVFPTYQARIYIKKSAGNAP